MKRREPNEGWNDDRTETEGHSNNVNNNNNNENEKKRNDRTRYSELELFCRPFDGNFTYELLYFDSIVEESFVSHKNRSVEKNVCC